MSGLRRSSNPYLKGMKPRRFFSGLKELIISQKQIKDCRAYNSKIACRTSH